MPSLAENNMGSAAARLYLVTPPVKDAAGFATTLKASLAVADVAAVLLRLVPGDESELVNCIRLLASVTEENGTALVLDGNVDLAKRSGSDGAHVTGIHALEGAVGRLKPGLIVGSGGMTTRHDAMLAAEAGADYVLFGEPDLNGERPSLGAIEDRVAWWAEVFEPPCVGYATKLD